MDLCVPCTSTDMDLTSCFASLFRLLQWGCIRSNEVNPIVNESVNRLNQNKHPTTRLHFHYILDDPPAEWTGST